MFSLNKSKLFHINESVFAKKWYRIIPVIASIISVVIADRVITNFFNVKIVQNNQKLSTVVLIANSITTIACAVCAYIFISSAIGRKSRRQFFNIASIYLGTFIALLGINIFAINYTVILPGYRTLTLALNIVTAVVASLISVVLYTQRKQIINFPDLIELMEIRQQLEQEIKVLKSTHPHIGPEDKIFTSEVILSTLSRASAFLEKLNNK